MAIFLKPKMKQQEECCIKIETGASIIAVLNCILTFGFCIVTAGFMFWILNDTVSLVEQNEHKPYIYNMLLLSGGMVIIFTLAITSFVFSLILATGVFKRNAEYVKIYFWYGVVVIALSIPGGGALSVLLLNTFVFDAQFFGTAVFAVFTSIAVYLPFLIVIRYTYKKFEREPMPASVVHVHQLVTEKCNKSLNI